MPSRPAPLRAVRAALFAAVCTALGATGHAHMSGADVPVWALAGAFGGVGLLAWRAAARRRTPAGITAAVLTAQALLHLAFSATGPAPAPAPGRAKEGTAGASPHTGHPVHAMDGMQGADTMHGLAADGMPCMHGMHGMGDMGGAVPRPVGGVDALLAMAGPGGSGMLLAHLLAGLLCAAWLAWGEATVFRLAGALGAAALPAARPLARALVLAAARPTPAPQRPAARAPYPPPRRLRGAVHAHALVRRGPPPRRSTRATAPGLPARARVPA